jgi:hypothetical protein
MTLDRFVDKLRHWGRPWTAGSEPVEIHRAILEDVEAQAVSVGGGRRLFPFDRVEVKLFADTPEERVRLAAIARGGWDLERDVPARLRAQGVRLPPGLAVAVEVTEERLPEFGERRYALAFRQTAAAVPEPVEAGDPGASGRSGARPGLRLSILKGKAGREVYDLALERVYLGRLEEVLDGGGRVKRRNDVAFVEEGRDEGSASGTLLLRNGRPIEVSRHDRRGVKLESGDEVYLGRAAIRVEIGS